MGEMTCKALDVNIEFWMNGCLVLMRPLSYSAA
jgi:hypothetical protein